MKIDPFKNKEMYNNWKSKVLKDGIDNLSKVNSDLILEYLSDNELGVNIASGSKKGGRSYNRLNALKFKLLSVFRKLDEFYKVKDIRKVTEKQLHALFSDMRKGVIKRNDGKEFKGVHDFVKDFKAFWHWYMRTNRKNGIDIPDLTIDLDVTKSKPDWVYLTEEQINQLAESSRYDYRVLIYFLYDTGIRAPTELMNIKVSDLSLDCKELNIRDEISKTFGRKIKLMRCSSLIKSYIESQGLKRDDYLFNIHYYGTNKYLKRLAKRVLGDGVSITGLKYSALGLYDFRHNSACYWLPKYPTQQGMMYRFGWKEANKIHYYTEFLGMKDNISPEDLITSQDKTKMELDLIKANQDVSFLKERVQILEGELKKVFNTNLQIMERLKGGSNKK